VPGPATATEPKHKRMNCSLLSALQSTLGSICAVLAAAPVLGPRSPSGPNASSACAHRPYHFLISLCGQPAQSPYPSSLHPLRRGALHQAKSVLGSQPAIVFMCIKCFGNRSSICASSPFGIITIRNRSWHYSPSELRCVRLPWPGWIPTLLQQTGRGLEPRITRASRYAYRRPCMFIHAAGEPTITSEAFAGSACSSCAPRASSSD